MAEGKKTERIELGRRVASEHESDQAWPAAGLVTSGNVFGYDPNGDPATNSFRNITINGGWTVGGGVEARLCGDWTGKIEYLYMNLGSMTTGVNNQQIMTLTAGFNSHITDKLVRAGINYKFD